MSALHHSSCGQGVNWTSPCTCDEVDYTDYAPANKAVPPPAPLDPRIEGLLRYVQHDVGCKANDLDYLDKTPCTCGLRALYNPKGIQDVAQ